MRAIWMSAITASTNEGSMKYKILLSLLVVSVLGCGDRVIRVITETLEEQLRGKTRQECGADSLSLPCAFNPSKDEGRQESEGWGSWSGAG